MQANASRRSLVLSKAASGHSSGSTSGVGGLAGKAAAAASSSMHTGSNHTMNRRAATHLHPPGGERLVTAPIEEQYTRLRERLDARHYKLPFRPDSMPLIAKLLDDVTVANDAYTGMQKTLDKTQGELRVAQGTVRPWPKHKQCTA